MVKMTLGDWVKACHNGDVNVDPASYRGNTAFPQDGPDGQRYWQQVVETMRAFYLGDASGFQESRSIFVFKESLGLHGVTFVPVKE